MIAEVLLVVILLSLREVKEVNYIFNELSSFKTKYIFQTRIPGGFYAHIVQCCFAWNYRIPDKSHWSGITLKYDNRK